MDIGRWPVCWLMARISPLLLQNSSRPSLRTAPSMCPNFSWLLYSYKAKRSSGGTQKGGLCHRGTRGLGPGWRAGSRTQNGRLPAQASVCFPPARKLPLPGALMSPHALQAQYFQLSSMVAPGTGPVRHQAEADRGGADTARPGFSRPHAPAVR